MERYVLGVFTVDVGNAATWLQAFITTIALLWAIFQFPIAIREERKSEKNRRVYEEERSAVDKHLYQLQTIAKAKIFIGRISSSLWNTKLIMENDDLNSAQFQSALGLPITLLTTDIEMLKKIIVNDLPELNVVGLISMAIGRAEQAVAALQVNTMVLSPNRDPAIFVQAQNRVNDIYHDIHEFHKLFEKDRGAGWINNGRVPIPQE